MVTDREMVRHLPRPVIDGVSSREGMSSAQTPETNNGSVAAGAGHFSSGMWDGLFCAKTPLQSSAVYVPTHWSVARRLIV